MSHHYLHQKSYERLRKMFTLPLFYIRLCEFIWVRGEHQNFLFSSTVLSRESLLVALREASLSTGNRVLNLLHVQETWNGVWLNVTSKDREVRSVIFVWPRAFQLNTGQYIIWGNWCREKEVIDYNHLHNFTKLCNSER